MSNIKKMCNDWWVDDYNKHFIIISCQFLYWSLDQSHDNNTVLYSVACNSFLAVDLEV